MDTVTSFLQSIIFILGVGVLAMLFCYALCMILVILTGPRDDR